MEKKKIKIDYDELEGAFDFSSFEIRHFLDMETGEIVLISESDEEQEIPDHYVGIPEPDSHEGYNDMVDFSATIKNAELNRLLSVALDGKGAFGRFKNVLYDFPEEQKRWYDFKEDRTRERIIGWLESLEIEYELT
ncbi:MAG: UPF0158 family protein [Bacteroidota bacterium]|nr:UPF0158 family protein [Bacteroidota bacterium]